MSEPAIYFGDPWNDATCERCGRLFRRLEGDMNPLCSACSNEQRGVTHAETQYDSTQDTRLHQIRVMELLMEIVKELMTRASAHDESKLGPVEKPIFDEFTPKLKGCTYGSDEYKGFLKVMKVALAYHYKKNPHHPEHYEEAGVRGMSLVDLIEMLADWKAATERHDDGNIKKSLVFNAERFSINHDLARIMWNTVMELGWYDAAGWAGAREEA